MKKLMIAAAAIAFASPAMAATDGDLSETSSTGTVDINVNIPKMVRISGLTDMFIQISPSSINNPYANNSTAADSFCVYSNDGPNGAYSLSVQANTTGGGSPYGGGRPWALAGDNGTYLPYVIYTGDVQSGGASFSWTGPSSTKTFESNGDGLGRRATLDCSDLGDNAIIRARVYNDDVLAAEAGDYTDTITVTVSVI